LEDHRNGGGGGALSAAPRGNSTVLANRGFGGVRTADEVVSAQKRGKNGNRGGRLITRERRGVTEGKERRLTNRRRHIPLASSVVGLKKNKVKGVSSKRTGIGLSRGGTEGLNPALKDARDRSGGEELFFRRRGTYDKDLGGSPFPTSANVIWESWLGVLH